MQPPGTEGSESVQPDARHRVSVAAQDRLMCERPFPASLASRRLSDRTVEDGGETVLCLLSVVKEGLWPWRSLAVGRYGSGGLFVVPKYDAKLTEKDVLDFLGQRPCSTSGPPW